MPLGGAVGHDAKNLHFCFGWFSLKSLKLVKSLSSSRGEVTYRNMSLENVFQEKAQEAD